MSTTITTARVRPTAVSTAFTNDEDAFCVEELQKRIVFLESENKKLSETVDWMHALIWDLYRKLRSPIQNKN